MFLNAALLKTILLSLRKVDSYYDDVEVVSTVAGGSVNGCYKLQSRGDYFFLKTNSSARYPMMFLAECEGLTKIGATNTVDVPQIVAVGEESGEQFLLMKWVQSGRASRRSHEVLGTGLAALHRNSAKLFGLDHDNYMGSLPQKNSHSDSWPNFFINNRLLPQLELASKRDLLDSALVRDFHTLFQRLEELTPPEKPSLVHGDLWGGNRMINSFGEPILIDPAISYGHREVDIAMTRLFGGFESFFMIAMRRSIPWKKDGTIVLISGIYTLC